MGCLGCLQRNVKVKLMHFFQDGSLILSFDIVSEISDCIGVFLHDGVVFL